MSDAYITLWSHAQVEVERRWISGDRELTHAANVQFRKAGVAR
ncbi:MAG TPA: hypothetical protein VK501_14095 [Baekduia sp.]|nr:hypothetical protein [Baekduia sp.]HMJ35038.1 hypothetical protein [Baekduia sp.]